MERIKKLIACLKELGLKPKIASFQDRLVIQKAVCLLQLLDVKIGYDYSLYVRGPYSPDLTRDLYENKEIVEQLRSDYSPSEIEKKKIAKLVELSDSRDPNLLEIMGTYSYLVKCLKMDNKNAVINLKNLKPFFSEADIAVGVNRAKELLFPPTEKEIREMKSESEDVEMAGVDDNKY